MSNNIISMEYDLQKKVLWMTGVNYLIDASIEDCAALMPRSIAATKGHISRKDLFCRVEFDGRSYTALSGRAENTGGDLLRNKINTIAGGETRVRLTTAMGNIYKKYGGSKVRLISRNEMTYRVET